VISIPAGDLSSLVVLYFLGGNPEHHDAGRPRAGGGILVDDSTVTIENTHRLWTEQGMPLAEATLHGAAEIAVPTLVSGRLPSAALFHLGGVPRRARPNTFSRRSDLPWYSRCWLPTGYRGP